MIDDIGNSVDVSGSGLITLTLKNTTKRKIGKIVGDTAFISRSLFTHVHRNSKSYGINELLTLFPISFIQLKDESGTYRIPVDIVKGSPARIFAQKGYEKQLFVPLDTIKKYKI